jgi:hypothetical protein
MTNQFSPLAIRRRLGRDRWAAPVESVGGLAYADRNGDGHVIVSTGWHDGSEWIHASMTRAAHVPLYEDLCHLRQAVFGAGWSYQVFAPPTHHINIHPNALHLWGRFDGERALPDFGRYGTI